MARQICERMFRSEPERAVKSCDRAIALEPDLGPAYLRRSQAYRALGDPMKADEDLAKARELGLEE